MSYTTEDAVSELRLAFTRMLLDSRFVAVLSREDGSFVQMCCVETSRDEAGMQPLGRAVVIDCPFGLLTKEQAARAKAHFGGRPSIVDARDENGSHFFNRTWMRVLGDAPGDAAVKCIEAFEAIYQPPPYPEYEVECFEGVVD